MNTGFLLLLRMISHLVHVRREQKLAEDKAETDALQPSPPWDVPDIPQALLAALKEKEIVNLKRPQSCKTWVSLSLQMSYQSTKSISINNLASGRERKYN